LETKLGVTEKGSAADVLEFGTGEKVSPEGIMSLTEKAGQKKSTYYFNGQPRISHQATRSEWRGSI
jgi:hypothetical protein